MTIDALIEFISEESQYFENFFFIPSRRQIESKHFGGGYVCKWDTETFCKYVKEYSLKIGLHSPISICRDHGGPWQGKNETILNLNEIDAYKSSDISFKSDIENGMRILHIDTCFYSEKNKNQSEALKKLFSIQSELKSYGILKNKTLTFEHGTEAQSDDFANRNYLKEYLNKLDEVGITEMPEYYVLQIGTKTIENRNIGRFVNGNFEDAELQELGNTIKMLHQKGIKIKGHNCDYLDDFALKKIRDLGVDAINIAPEFAFIESNIRINKLKKFNNELCEQLTEKVLNKNTYHKWSYNGCFERLKREEVAALVLHYHMEDHDIKKLISKSEEIINYNKDLEHEIKHALKEKFSLIANSFIK